jgi:hypothetical protein
MPKSQTQLNTEIMVNFYTQLKNNILTDEQVKVQIDYLDRNIYQKQLDKVKDNFPEIQNWEEFEGFLKHFGVLKEGGSTGGGGGQKSLASIETAKEKGVPEEVIPDYIAAVNKLYDAKEGVEKFLVAPYPNVAISIPKRVSKKAKDDAAEASAE